MAGGPRLIHQKQDGVAVTVEAHLLERLQMPGSLALAPEGPTAARPVAGVPVLQGAFDGFPVHPGEHEDVPAVGVLGDGGHQTVGVELHRVQQVVEGDLVAELCVLEVLEHLSLRIFPAGSRTRP